MYFRPLNHQLSPKNSAPSNPSSALSPFASFVICRNAKPTLPELYKYRLTTAPNGSTGREYLRYCGVSDMLDEDSGFHLIPERATSASLDRPIPCAINRALAAQRQPDFLLTICRRAAPARPRKVWAWRKHHGGTAWLLPHRSCSRHRSIGDDRTFSNQLHRRSFQSFRSSIPMDKPHGFSSQDG